MPETAMLLTEQEWTDLGKVCWMWLYEHPQGEQRDVATRVLDASGWVAPSVTNKHVYKRLGGEHDG